MRHLGVLFPNRFSYPRCPATETTVDQAWGGFGSVACGHARREPEMRTPPGTWRASTLVRALGLAYPWPAHCLAPRALGQGSPRPALETPVSPRGSFPGLDSPLYRVVEYIPSLPLLCGDSHQLSRQSGTSWVTRGGAPLQSKTVCVFFFFSLSLRHNRGHTR